MTKSSPGILGLTQGKNQVKLREFCFHEMLGTLGLNISFSVEDSQFTVWMQIEGFVGISMLVIVKKGWVVRDILV